jgi:hypothetical protein
VLYFVSFGVQVFFWVLMFCFEYPTIIPLVVLVCTVDSPVTSWESLSFPVFVFLFFCGLGENVVSPSLENGNSMFVNIFIYLLDGDYMPLMA